MDPKVSQHKYQGARLKSRFRPLTFTRHVKWEYLFAGMSGGVVSTLVLHPLDLVKTRFQVNDVHGLSVTNRPQYTGIVHAFRSIFATRGFTGLYQGVTPNVWGSGISWGSYLLFYHSIKTWMQDGDSKKALGPSRHILIASEAGFLTLMVTNPITVAKTRLCLQYETQTPNPSLKVYNGTMDVLWKIYNYEGVRGLYKGFVPGVFGISHGAIQFMIYEEMKYMYNHHKNTPVDARLTTTEYLTFAAMSKVISATITYPYQVLRSRLQEQHRSYNGVVDVTRDIIKYEGVRGLFKGFSVYLCHVIPNVCIVFMIYEHIVHWKK